MFVAHCCDTLKTVSANQLGLIKCYSIAADAAEVVFSSFFLFVCLTLWLPDALVCISELFIHLIYLYHLDTSMSDCKQNTVCICVNAPSQQKTKILNYTRVFPAIMPFVVI